MIDPWYRTQNLPQVQQAQLAMLKANGLLMVLGLGMAGPFFALLLWDTFAPQQLLPLIAGSIAAVVPILGIWWHGHERRRIDFQRSAYLRVFFAGGVGIGLAAAIFIYLPWAPFAVQAILICGSSLLCALAVGIAGSTPVTVLAFALPVNIASMAVAVGSHNEDADYLALFVAMSALGQLSLAITTWQNFVQTQFFLVVGIKALGANNIAWIVEDKNSGTSNWSPNFPEMFGVTIPQAGNPLAILRNLIAEGELDTAPPDDDVAGQWLYRVRLPHGPVRLVRETALRFSDVDPAVAVFQRTIQDVTLTEALRINLEEMNEAKNQFIANVSHDMRTPANGLVGMLRLLADTKLSPEQHEFVNAAQDSATSLRGMLDDLLDVARLESASLVLDRKSFSIRGLIDAQIAAFGPLADQNGISLSARVAPDVPPFLVGDPIRLRQILNKLISNSIKYTMIGGVQIDVDTLTRSHATMLRISVSDTGMGFSEDARAKLFSALTQPDSSLTRRSGESGMGLTIARGLAIRMGGELGCESEIGRGSVFRLEIPMEIAETLPDQTVLDAKPYFARSLKVFAADDHPVNRMLLRSILLKWGHEVETFENGQDLLSALAHTVPDLIVMDIQMPIMDGVTATRAIRQMAAPYRQIPILGFTADADPKHRGQFLQAGMDDCLVKPMNFDSFARALSELTATDRPAV